VAAALIEKRAKNEPSGQARLATMQRNAAEKPA
jgi:hypothetical protein